MIRSWAKWTKEMAGTLLSKLSNSGQQFVFGWPIMNFTKSGGTMLRRSSAGHKRKLRMEACGCQVSKVTPTNVTGPVCLTCTAGAVMRAAEFTLAATLSINNGRKIQGRAIMKTKAYTTILAVIALVLFSAVGAPAQTEHQHGAQKPMQHDMSKMDMSAMMNEPHHALAMAFMQNIGTFAKIVHSQAEGNSPLNANVVRDAVGEMKRSLDQMEEHHGEHMKMMSEEMRTHMAAMMKDMKMHHSMLKDAVSALENDVKSDQPDSKHVAAHSADVLKHLDEMSKMHDNKKMKM
jgi:hypothetical protein